MKQSTSHSRSRNPRIRKSPKLFLVSAVMMIAVAGTVALVAAVGTRLDLWPKASTGGSSTCAQYTDKDPVNCWKSGCEWKSRIKKCSEFDGDEAGCSAHSPACEVVKSGTGSPSNPQPTQKVLKTKCNLVTDKDYCGELETYTSCFYAQLKGWGCQVKKIPGGSAFGSCVGIATKCVGPDDCGTRSNEECEKQTGSGAETRTEAGTGTRRDTTICKGEYYVPTQGVCSGEPKAAGGGGGSQPTPTRRITPPTNPNGSPSIAPNATGVPHIDPTAPATSETGTDTGTRTGTNTGAAAGSNSGGGSNNGGGSSGSGSSDVCSESCPAADGVLRSCTPPEADDGTSNDSKCDAAGRVASCGGQSYCCPTAGGSWTTDMSACGVAANTRGNYCSALYLDTPETVGSLSEGEFLELSSESNTPVNDFWFFAYNKDNEYSKNNPKPICVAPGIGDGNQTTLKGGCPGNSQLLVYKYSSATPTTESDVLEVNYDEIFVEDANWDYDVATNVQFNAYFSKTGGPFSLPMPDCAKPVKAIY